MEENGSDFIKMQTRVGDDEGMDSFFKLFIKLFFFFPQMAGL